ncbi:MAG: glycosyltransferase family 4 protein [Muribaculaceae bacterium]|nr:glycosyltransferase family 4 protein [Muribaculaceae bacterium]
MEDSNPKKIIRMTTIPGSMRKLLQNQLKFMSQHGYEVVALSSDDECFDDMLHEQGDIRGIRVNMERHTSPWKDLKALIKIYRVFREEKPFIVHTHTPKAGLLGMLAAKLAKVPNRLHTTAGLPLLVYSGMYRKVLNAMERLTNACATQVFPNSFNMMKTMEELKLCKPKKMQVIGKGSSNGIDTEHFSVSKTVEDTGKDRYAWRSELGLAEDDFAFVFVGRVVKDKGINELVNCMRRLLPRFSNCKLIMVGRYESDLDPIAPENVEFFKNDKSSIFMGWQKDVRPFFMAADALVFPSYREGFPNVVMQAGAMGLPSIVTDINGCNEIIEDGKNGRIIPPQNEEALYKMMGWFLSNSNEVIQMADNARGMIVSRYERQTIWQEILKVYNSLT